MKSVNFFLFLVSKQLLEMHQFYSKKHIEVIKLLHLIIKKKNL
jgi:hypothetical protein